MPITASTSQSPAVNDADPQFVAVPVASEVPVVAAGLMNSRTLPALTLSLVAVPTMFGFVMLAPAGIVTVPEKLGDASGA